MVSQETHRQTNRRLRAVLASSELRLTIHQFVADGYCLQVVAARRAH